MKSFLDHLKEEVLPTVQVADGGLDISKPSVRAAINAAIAGVVSQPAVTPYVVFNRLSKLLAQYHIVLPKRFLEGDKGVEVFEVKQFGHKMGMTDSGEFVNEVPATHYLFLQYGILSPFGITYAKPVVGGMFKVMARLVDKEELDKLMDMAEITMAEEAEVNQAIAKANAPKEKMHTALGDCDCSQGDSPSTKKAVKVSMKKIDEDKDPCWKGYEMIGMKKKGGKPVPNCVPVKEEEQIDEISRETARSYLEKSKGPRITLRKDREHMKHGQSDKKEWDDNTRKLRNKIQGRANAEDRLFRKEEAINEVSVGKLIRYKSKAASQLTPDYYPSDPSTAHGKKEIKREKGHQLASKKLMGKAKVGASLPKHPYMEETQLDELKKSTLASYIKKAHVSGLEAASQGEIAYANKDKAGLRAANKTGEKREQGIERAAGKLAKEETISEKAPPGAKFERMVKHIKKGYAEKDGLSKKEKSIAYATAWKAKNREKGE